MSKRAFVVADNRASPIANDVTDFRYRAAVRTLAVDVQVPARSHHHAETQFMVEEGMLEFMVGGAAGYVLPGDFVRVPPGVACAYRNAGETQARVLVRTTSPEPVRRAIRVGIDFAA